MTQPGAQITPGGKQQRGPQNGYFQKVDEQAKAHRQSNKQQRGSGDAAIRHKGRGGGEIRETVST
jgi:hypothetical protein